MLLFAHLGLTLAAAKLTERFGLRPDLPIVLLGSILPDLIDKPLGYLIYGSMATGRIFAHTLLFLLVLVALAAILKSRPLGSLAFGVLAHQALDTIWRTPEVFLWPLLGPFPVKAHVSVLGYFEMLMRGLQNPGIFIPELLGLLILAYLVLLRWPHPSIALRGLKTLLSCPRRSRPKESNPRKKGAAIPPKTVSSVVRAPEDPPDR